MDRDANDTLIFVRVVREGSFTAAALALQVPKTTVSRRVRQLEKHIGTQLIRRTTRKLSLTEAGAIYFEQCRGLVDTLDAAELAVHQLRDDPRGWLRVTMPYSFGVEWLAPLFAGFRRRYPDVRLEIIASHATLDLVENELDIALRLGELPDSSLVARRLTSFRSGTFASPRYLKRAGTPSKPDDLRDHQVLTLHQAQRDTGYVWPLRRQGGKQRSFVVNPVIVANDPAFIKDALLQGEGISLGMEQSMAADVAAGRLVRVLPEWMGPMQEFNALSPQERMPSPKVRAFIDYLKEHLRFTQV